MPEHLEGLSGELSLFSGQTITLTEAALGGIDEIPETLTEIPGGRRGQLALMEKLGGYIVKVSRACSGVTENLPKDLETADPAGFRTGRQVARDDFSISESLTYLQNSADRKEFQYQIQNMLPNLGNSPESQSFRKGLQGGDLEFILDCFNWLEKNIHESLIDNPAPNVPVNNEVKPANVGAVYDASEIIGKLPKVLISTTWGLGLWRMVIKLHLKRIWDVLCHFSRLIRNPGIFMPIMPKPQ